MEKNEKKWKKMKKMEKNEEEKKLSEKKWKEKILKKKQILQCTMPSLHWCMGHTAWAPEGREGRNQAA